MPLNTGVGQVVGQPIERLDARPQRPSRRRAPGEPTRRAGQRPAERRRAERVLVQRGTHGCLRRTARRPGAAQPERSAAEHRVADVRYDEKLRRPGSVRRPPARQRWACAGPGRPRGSASGTAGSGAGLVTELEAPGHFAQSSGSPALPGRRWRGRTGRTPRLGIRTGLGCFEFSRTGRSTRRGSTGSCCLRRASR